jgi:hypothetical protein
MRVWLASTVIPGEDGRSEGGDPRASGAALSFPFPSLRSAGDDRGAIDVP